MYTGLLVRGCVGLANIIAFFPRISKDENATAIFHAVSLLESIYDGRTDWLGMCTKFWNTPDLR